MRSLLEGSGTHITWELFKKKFYTEYFPDSVRFAKEVEFLQLVQGGMSVSEYTDKFKHLIRFHTLTMNEEWLCRKFENGLRGDIKLLVAGLCIKEFPALVERAKVLEKIKKEVESQQSHPLRVGGPSRSKSNFNARRTPYSRPPSHGSRVFSSQLPVQSGQFRQHGSVSCFHCGGPHLRSACPQLVGYKRCNKCKREGHYERDCPMARRASSQSHQAGRSQQRGGARPQAAGRVYAFSGAEATISEEDEIVLEQVLDGDAADA
ncbi:uncharacterized protein LOC106755708 isoform X2 [Vigna radiata var. radiata]|uniref:Uncharacterized protein LOC106755708 isoform X2 n=1 Tax=Vigna radiata var. radiata TaxID=3916 RepID=A0A1S3THZ8_VIGRR|nr:uncharacterized protein LOC106755708 isoform X2 [Vigna radiata var. radiata]